MKIKFYAHACFRLEGDGTVVVTDPYTPGPGASKFRPGERTGGYRDHVVGDG